MFTFRRLNLLGRSCSRAVLSCAAAIALLAAAPSASAQFGGRASFGEAFQRDFLERDVSLIVQVLQLEPAQRDVVEVLITDYTSSFMAGVEAAKDRMKTAADRVRSDSSAGTPNRDRMLDAIMKVWDEWRTEKRRLSDALVADIKGLLGSQQLELWPKLERSLRRERQLPEGALSGESVNLWVVLKQMQLTDAETEAVQPKLDEYELRLDEALLARVTRIEQLTGELRQAMTQMSFDKGAEIQDKIMALRMQVRAANDEGIESIAAAMGARGAEFKEQALKAAYEDAFRPHPVLTLIDQALAIETLSPEQRKAIQELRTEMTAVSLEGNQRFYEMLRTEEPKVPRRKIEEQLRRMQQSGGAGQPTPQSANENDPIIKARVEREQLGEPYRARLMAILTPEQQPDLPGGMKLNAERAAPKDPDAKSRPSQGQESVGAGRQQDDPMRGRASGRRDPRNPNGGSGQREQPSGR